MAAPYVGGVRYEECLHCWNGFGTHQGVTRSQKNRGLVVEIGGRRSILAASNFLEVVCFWKIRTARVLILRTIMWGAQLQSVYSRVLVSTYEVPIIKTVELWSDDELPLSEILWPKCQSYETSFALLGWTRATVLLVIVFSERDKMRGLEWPNNIPVLDMTACGHSIGVFKHHVLEHTVHVEGVWSYCRTIQLQDKYTL